MTTERRRHVVTVLVEGQEIGGWTEYEVSASMIHPAEQFSLRRPFDAAAWKLLRRDARVRVLVDGVPILDGLIDGRKRNGKENELEISGRDRAGRLRDESAPAINYQGLELSEAIRRLAEPWFTRVTLSDARDRKLRLGKGHKVPTGKEPIIVRSATRGGGRVQVGQTRRHVIDEITSQLGILCWSSADGLELVAGRPNYQQAAQFVVRLAKIGGALPSTCTDLVYEEDNANSYSMIAVVGSGGGTASDYGASATSRRAVSYDFEPRGGEKGAGDGTGGNFIYPKRLLMPERNFDSNQDAQEMATRDRARRDFRQRTMTAQMPEHGQFSALGAMTLFAPNTIARVVDEELPLDEDFLIYACTYRCQRQRGETTQLEMVPRGTEIVP